MMAGYAFGMVMVMPADRRRSICLRLGAAATALFVVLRALNVYGDPRPWSADGRMPALLSFLNTTKYPASLSFLLMALGPSRQTLIHAHVVDRHQDHRDTAHEIDRLNPRRGLPDGGVE